MLNHTSLHFQMAVTTDWTVWTQVQSTSQSLMLSSTPRSKNIRNGDIVWLENKYKASVNEYMVTKQMDILPGCVKKKSSVLKYLFSSFTTVTVISKGYCKLGDAELTVFIDWLTLFNSLLSAVVWADNLRVRPESKWKQSIVASPSLRLDGQ